MPGTRSARAPPFFLPGAVYDYLNNPAEVFVFDRPQNRFFLLDPMRRCAANLSAQEVAAFTHQLRARLEKQGDAYLKFLANLCFERSSGDAPDVLNLSSPWLTYEVDATPCPMRKLPMPIVSSPTGWAGEPDAGTFVAAAFRPDAIELPIGPAEFASATGETHDHHRPGPVAKRRTIRSEHQWVDRLSEADVDRVAQTRQFMEIFNPVSIQQFCRK